MRKLRPRSILFTSLMYVQYAGVMLNADETLDLYIYVCNQVYGLPYQFTCIDTFFRQWITDISLSSYTVKTGVLK